MELAILSKVEQLSNQMDKHKINTPSYLPLPRYKYIEMELTRVGLSPHAISRLLVDFKEKDGGIFHCSIPHNWNSVHAQSIKNCIQSAGDWSQIDNSTFGKYAHKLNFTLSVLIPKDDISSKYVHQRSADKWIIKSIKALDASQPSK